MVKYGIYAVSKLREPGKLVAEAKDLRMKNGKGTAGVHPGVQKPERGRRRRNFS